MELCLAVVGLSSTAMDSLIMGRNVVIGAFRSLFHGLTYVMRKKVLTPSTSLDATNAIRTH